MSTLTESGSTPTRQPVSQHAAFELLSEKTIESLNIVVEEYRHKKTGAMHYHLNADHDENVFMVALRTVPQDSTGVAHILEHTALCGSERYPVRDPFFMMIRRSLNTFMNAFTSSDWTAYPFASQNKKDFDNLLHIYLDAVFFSRLDPLDFAQEGHRLEFADKRDPSSDLEYKGVVYNEMKGAMSSPTSILWQTLTKYLNPTNTYHNNSGGDPEHIVDLTYEDLKAFYESHYHPSNATLLTFGDIPAEQHHDRFEALALNRFEELPTKIEVSDEKRYYAPIQVTEGYPVEDGEIKEKTHLVMGWLLGHSTNLDELLEANFLSSLLLDHSASPLRKALEQSDLGRSPSPLCGLEDSNKEMAFMCGIEGSEPERTSEFEALVLNTLEQVAKEGLSQETLESVLHQLELSQREIGGDGYPYGMQLILGGLSGAIHRGDFVSLIDLEPSIQALREKIKQPNFVSDLIYKYLLTNSHRVTLTLYPDEHFSDRRTEQEQQQLRKIKAALTEPEKQAIVDQAVALEERQGLQEDESILPKVTLEDVKPDINVLNPNVDKKDASEFWSYEQGTNGLVYQQLIAPLSGLTFDEVSCLPWFSQCLTQVGVGDKSYLQQQEHLYATSGGISASSTLRALPSDQDKMATFFTLSGKALARNKEVLSESLAQVWQEARFDEIERIEDLLSQSALRREAGITQQGHGLAMQAASSGFSKGAWVGHELTGLPSIARLKRLVRQEGFGSEIAAQLNSLKSKVLQGCPSHFLFVNESEWTQAVQEKVGTLWSSVEKQGTADEQTLPFSEARESTAWLTNTQVHFCAKAYKTVAAAHPDAAPLTVLGGYLRNGFLHRAIREQGGAYGGGATHDLSTGVFKFYSYRDPRLSGTLKDFDASLGWLLEESQDPEKMEQAILGVIASLDKPGSPAGEAKQDFHYRITGRFPEFRQTFRERVLKTTLEDLRRVAAEYLQPELANVAVVSHAGAKSELKDLGLTLYEV